MNFGLDVVEGYQKGIMTGFVLVICGIFLKTIGETVVEFVGKKKKEDNSFKAWGY